ncbi:MAG: peptidylprolyl isomerase [Bacteroidales bacterium]|nr:peptidylprolyl isomerase [Candidatus Cryptobacteroides aphodequi]
MKIAKNTVAALSYQLEVEGKIADKAGADAPLEYIHGNHMLLPRFEEEVEGKEPGETFEFTLCPEEGYGSYREGLLIDLPLEAFPEDEELRAQLLVVGQILPLMSSQGQMVQGVVKEILEKSVKVDLNHPMAGKTLHFTGSVVSVREATEKELLEGLHGEFLPQEECSCGCHHGEGEECGCGCHHDEGEECGCGHHHEGCHKN